MIKLVEYINYNDFKDKFKDTLEELDKSSNMYFTNSQMFSKARSLLPSVNTILASNLRRVNDEFYGNYLLLKDYDVDRIDALLLESLIQNFNVIVFTNLKSPLEEDEQTKVNSLKEVENLLSMTDEFEDYDVILDEFHLFDKNKKWADYAIYEDTLNLIDKKKFLIILPLYTPRLNRIISSIKWNGHEIHIIKLH